MLLHALITSDNNSKVRKSGEFLEISVRDDNDQQELMMIRIDPIEGTNQYNVRMMAKLRDSGYELLGSSIDDDGKDVYKVQEFTLHGTD